MKLKKFIHLKTILLSIWSYRLVRVILATIFLWSGLAKLIDPASFAVIIEAFGLIPESLSMQIAVGLPVLEILLAIGLLLDISGSLTIVTGLLLMFMAILIYGILIGLDVDCGCFGSGDSVSEIFHGLRPTFYRDMMMMMGVVYLYMWRYFRPVKTV